MTLLAFFLNHLDQLPKMTVLLTPPFIIGCIMIIDISGESTGRFLRTDLMLAYFLYI